MPAEALTPQPRRRCRATIWLRTPCSNPFAILLRREIDRRERRDVDRPNRGVS